MIYSIEFYQIFSELNKQLRLINSLWIKFELIIHSQPCISCVIGNSSLFYLTRPFAAQKGSSLVHHLNSK